MSICQPGAWFTSGPLWSQLYNVLGAHACLLLGGVAGSRPEEPSQDKEATPTSRAMNLRIPRQGSLDKKNDLCWHLLDPYLWAILFFINLNESNHIFQKILFFLVNCSAAELLLTQQRDGLLNFNIKDYHYVLFVNVYICILLAYSGDRAVVLGGCFKFSV